MKKYRIVKINSDLVDAVLDSPKLPGTHGIQNRLNRVIREWLEPPESRQDAAGAINEGNVGYCKNSVEFA